MTERNKNKSGEIWKLTVQNVNRYFTEHDINDLMNYGSDYDEGLYKLTNFYSDILDDLGINYLNIYTEDGSSSGRYVTTVIFDSVNKMNVHTYAWDGRINVTKNVFSIYSQYDELKKEINIIDVNNGKIDKIQNDIDSRQITHYGHIMT